MQSLTADAPDGRPHVNHTRFNRCAVRATIHDLPAEMICTILGHTGAMMAPIVRCVSSLWRALVPMCRWKEKIDAVPMLADRKEYHHVCSSSRKCAIHHAKLVVDRGWWNVIEWMLDCAGPFGHPNDLDAYACDAIVIMGDGDLDRLDLWTQRGMEWTHCRAWAWAARRAQMDIVEWFLKARTNAAVACMSDSVLARAAAEGGHMALVQRLAAGVKHIDDSERVCDAAARHGHLALLKWLRENDFRMGPNVCAKAAKGGHLNVLLWVSTKCRKHDKWTFAAAASGGHMHILQRLEGQFWTQDIDTAAIAAAQAGHLHILEWLMNHRLYIPLGTSASLLAALGGHWHIVRWLHEKGHPWDERTCHVIAERGNLEMLQWARANGCPWDERVCASAASRGDLEMLQWARANRCPWDERTAPKALLGGHLHILKWALHRGCPQGEVTCDRAAECGYLPILVWLRRKGYPWSAQTCVMAAQGGHLYVVRWALAHGCPYDRAVSVKAAHGGHWDVVEWLRSNGYAMYPRIEQ